MKPKYTTGSNVRIKPQDLYGKTLNPEIKTYENMIGKIVDVSSVIAYRIESRIHLGDAIDKITTYNYSVRINDQITIRDILEDCLE